MYVSKNRLLAVTGVLAVVMASGQPLKAAEIVDQSQSQSQVQLSDSQKLVVEDSQLTIHLWETIGTDGKAEILFAFENSDGSISGVSEQQPVLHLRSGNFDPLNRPEDSASRIQARMDTEMFIVQYITTPRSEYREVLERLGVSILPGYLAGQANVVRMSAGMKDRVSELPWVRWVGPVEPEMKLAQGLGVDSIKEGETMPVRVTIQPASKASQLELSDITESLGGSIQWVRESGSSIDLVVNRDALKEILRSDNAIAVSKIQESIEESADSRVMSGAPTLESISGNNSEPGFNSPYTGHGVRAEIFDIRLDLNNAIIANVSKTPVVRYNFLMDNTNPHASATYSNLFAKDDPLLYPSVVGMIPDAQGIFNSTKSIQSGGFGFSDLSRDCVTRPLMQHKLDPTLEVPVVINYQAVLQSKSSSPAGDKIYNDLTEVVDKIAFYYDFMIVQGSGNTIGKFSDEALAKNIITAGGVIYHGTPNDLSDDTWSEYPNVPGAEPGFGPVDAHGDPAVGRIKPDLVQAADDIWSANGFGSPAALEISGVSFSTPVIAGSAGLAFEMWGRQYPLGSESGENIFGHTLSSTSGNPHPDVFNNRPGPAVIKALLINTASPYDWNLVSGSPNSAITRDVQGWGLPDHVKLFKRALWDRDAVESLTPCVASQSYPSIMHVLNESAILSTVGTEYSVCFEVLPTDTELRATLVWSDPPPSALCGGNPLVNDLDLTVIAPDGTTVYLGNYGLVEDGDPMTNHGIWSAPGGAADELNNVENVFIDAANLQAGVYQIKAKLVTLCDDGNVPIWTGCTGDDDEDNALPTGGTHDVKFAVVVTRGPCDADFNQDGVVDTADSSAFLSGFAANSKRADLTNDGYIDFLDISKFITSISEGCP